MNLLKKRIWIALVLVAGLLAGGVATATPITMNFDGLKTGTSVQQYYNGGCTSWLFGKSCNGPENGVVWKGATVGDGFAGFLLSDSATMNIAAGFDGGLSFNYYNVSNSLFSGSVSVYSRQNGKGIELASLNLDATRDWKFFELAFSGIAKSVTFNGSPLLLTGFDNVTLGLSAPTTPVPEPAALGVFGLGLLLMGAFAGVRRRYN